MSNPLLSLSHLPQFAKIEVKDIPSAIMYLLEKNKKITQDLLSKNKFTFNLFALPLELLNMEFQETWGIVEHLNSVQDSPELRIEYEKLLPVVTEYFATLRQNETLYKAYCEIESSADFIQLNYAQQKLVQNAIRDFKLSGVGLPENEKNKFKQLEVEISELEDKFSKNILDSTAAWTYFIPEEEHIKCKGIPNHLLQEAKNLAERKRDKGYLFTLEYPCVDGVLSYAEDRQLREIIYTAYYTIASDQGPHDLKWDNTGIMLSILEKRQEQAKLLGYNNFAEYSLATKMVKDPNEVIIFLRDLLNKAKPKALIQFEELKSFAKQEFGWQEIYAWDVRFLTERLKLQQYAYSEESLRDYFPESVVLKGFFDIVHALYGIHIREIEKFDKWHETVRLFEVLDNQNERLGFLYIDLYVRSNKRQGAWCGDCRARYKDMNHQKIKHPVAYIVANFTNPLPNQEAYFTHDEVLTLFHEFGHGLHHVLTKVDYPSLSGTQGVEWDAVELPSQFMENWCYQKQSLDMISSNKETKENLPEFLFTKIKAAENFQGGLSIIRQIEFALFDMKLHMQLEVKNIQSILDAVRQEVSVISIPKFNKFQNSFSHIFAGGYAAGYYSYLWSEMLSADAFSAFEEQGIFNRIIGEKFLKTILEMGGSKDAMTLFKTFRGRQPVIDALLKQRELN